MLTQAGTESSCSSLRFSMVACGRWAYEEEEEEDEDEDEDEDEEVVGHGPAGGGRMPTRTPPQPPASRRCG